ELETHIEMIFDGRFSTTGDNDDRLYAGRHRLFDSILDQRFVDQRQHLLWLRFGRRQEPSSKSSGWKYCFPHLLGHQSPLYALKSSKPPAQCTHFVSSRRDVVIVE